MNKNGWKTSYQVNLFKKTFPPDDVGGGGARTA